MKFVVVSYYTADTLYTAKAKTFRDSMERLHIPFYVECIDSRGSWEHNVTYKPEFLLRMLDKFPDTAIVWVDCDAVFHRYPVLFEQLDCPIAVHVWRRPKRRISEDVLIGSIFLGNTQPPSSLAVLTMWDVECKRRMEKQGKASAGYNRRVWDQNALAAVLNRIEFDELPGTYCKIFDKMDDVVDPVIVHHQASRQVRRQNGGLHE